MSNLRDWLRNPALHLFRVMVLNESDTIIYGAKGTGKTSLVKNALYDVPEDYAIVVFDVTGSYEGYVDYHAPYPLNPMDYLEPLPLLDALLEALTMRFPRLQYVMTPAMDFELLRLLEGKIRSIRDIISTIRNMIESGSILAEDELNTAKALLRRLTYFNHWIFSKTHPLIDKLLRGELRGKSIGLDLHFLDSVQRWFYVISFLSIVNSIRATNLIFVIDEAHLYFRIGESTLTAIMRMGRNIKDFFALITQSPKDIPNEFISMNKVFIEFPIAYMDINDLMYNEKPWRRFYGRGALYGEDEDEKSRPIHWTKPYTALMKIHATNPSLMDILGASGPVAYIPVTVDVKKPPRQGTITLRKCSEYVGIDVNTLLKRGFEEGSLDPAAAEKLPRVWDCIGGDLPYSHPS